MRVTQPRGSSLSKQAPAWPLEPSRKLRNRSCETQRIRRNHMLAFRYHPGKKNLVQEEIDKPTAGPNDAILRIRAAGVCHSDIHVLDGEVPSLKDVFTM